MDGQYKLPVNEDARATELILWRVGGTVRQNPHMRAFWLATISFFLAFLGWFALAPLGLEVARSMEICENQLYPPLTNPKRKAYLKFKSIKNGKEYCRYGKNDKTNPTDCKEPPKEKKDLGGEAAEKYRPKILAKCVCSAGTKCRTTLVDAGVASVSSTMLVRVALGTLLERFGPVNCQTSLMLFGSFWVAMAAAITAPWNFILIRFFIGMAGAAFVTNQFWSSLMFAPNVVGTANATAGGWGNLGGGVTQIFMVAVLFNPFVAGGLSENAAWRVSMSVPAATFVIVAVCMKLFCWDTPTTRRYDTKAYGKASASMWDYVECLKDPRVVVMVMQYGACFGTELVMNNQLATHFRSYFQMEATAAAGLAASFGGMNLFARSLGGMLSDTLFKRFGFPGRIWAQFWALFFEAIFLLGFGFVDNTNPWYVALLVLIGFSTCVQMAEGTSYGIVPFMNRKQLAVVSALVGAGGNLGAVIAGKGFYANIADELLPFKIHAGYVMFWTLMTPIFWWPHLGGMFVGPRQTAEAAEAEDGAKRDEPANSEDAANIERVNV